MSQIFKGFGLSSVWEFDSWTDKNCEEALFTPEILAAVENELGYKLPQDFAELMAVQSDGTFVKNYLPTTQRDSWASNHVRICKASGIGSEKEGSLRDEVGQKLWLEKWGYPPIGAYFANDPSGEYALFTLDYRECGKDGESKVVFVGQELDFEIVELTPDFETFTRCSRHEDEFSGE